METRIRLLVQLIILNFMAQIRRIIIHLELQLVKLMEPRLRLLLHMAFLPWHALRSRPLSANAYLTTADLHVNADVTGLANNELKLAVLGLLNAQLIQRHKLLVALVVAPCLVAKYQLLQMQQLSFRIDLTNHYGVTEQEKLALWYKIYMWFKVVLTKNNELLSAQLVISQQANTKSVLPVLVAQK